jgi:excisionase family DNA binding protein
MSDPNSNHPDIAQRADKAAQRQTRAAKAAERRKRVERLAYSVMDAATAMGRDPATVWRWIKNGTLRASYVGGSTLIPKAELDRILTEGTPRRKHQPRAASGQFLTKQSGDSGPS